VPWDAFDVLFLGGTTDWKLGPAAADLTAEARRRGLVVHMGRVVWALSPCLAWSPSGVRPAGCALRAALSCLYRPSP
jgi:hypothetical protein